MSGNLTIGKRIALLRKAKSLTQQRLSELTGKSRGVIAQIEKDMVKPDYEFIGLFVRKLNIPYEWVFEPSETVEDWLVRGVKIPDQIEGSLIDEKGGSVKGSLIDEKENQKHIKPKSKDYTKEYIGNTINEDGNPYGNSDSIELIKFRQTHVRVMNKLLDRIDELELELLKRTHKIKK
ncbi:helix-turn-helix transcriptional regulator [Cyclobacterium marinum]|uniref:helix-turn-helix domain-containing protein n=1 Tax=Cyclobacterium marinum TaxID=104 RepID=UPI0030D7D5D2